MYFIQGHQIQESFDSTNKQPFQLYTETVLHQHSSEPMEHQYFVMGPTETEESSLYDVVSPNVAEGASPYEIPSSLGVKDIQTNYLSP